MIKEIYKQLTSLIPSELLLAHHIGGITTINIHILCRVLETKGKNI